MNNKPLDQARAWELLQEVEDPEIPVISVVDLGIVRNISVLESTVQVQITPTYSGCPAFEVIKRSIIDKLQGAGFAEVLIDVSYSPPWSTEFLSEVGKEKLRAYGISPPGSVNNLVSLPSRSGIACPRCSSTNTRLVSEFGATPCKAFLVCSSCQEPFEHFKEH